MTATQQRVTFTSAGNDVAGLLWLPDGFDDTRKYPALIVSTPGSSVKEQIGSNYGARLADRGFVFLTFDPSHQGQSSGEPRDLEDPAVRIEDLRCGVDYLTTRTFVDAERIGMLGICAGGGYAVSATMTDHRLKALGTVVAVNIGRAVRQGASVTPGALAATLETAGAERSREARGEQGRRDPWIPDTPDEARAQGITDRDVLDAVDFYRTPRGHQPTSTNRMLFRSNALLAGYDAFHLVGELLTQPLQVIVGGRIGTTGSYEDGLLLSERTRSTTDLLVIDGAGHYDLYDKPEYVDQAVDRLAAFYDERLKAG